MITMQCSFWVLQVHHFFFLLDATRWPLQHNRGSVPAFVLRDSYLDLVKLSSFVILDTDSTLLAQAMAPETLEGGLLSATSKQQPESESRLG